MKEKLEWEEFRYLNGVRKNCVSMMLSVDEYQQGLSELGIISVNGAIETKMRELSAQIAELNTLLMLLVQKERKKDISLYLDDI